MGVGASGDGDSLYERGYILRGARIGEAGSVRVAWAAWLLLLLM